MSATNRSSKPSSGLVSSRDLIYADLSETFEYERRQKETDQKKIIRIRAKTKEYSKKILPFASEDEESISANFKVNSKDKKLFYFKNKSALNQPDMETSSKRSEFHFAEDSNPFIVRSVPMRTRKNSHGLDDDDFENFETHSSTKKSYDYKTKIYSFDLNEDRYLEKKYFGILLRDQAKFLITCCPKETLVRCNIRVEKRMYSEYFLYLESDQYDPNEPICFTKHKKSVISSAYSFKTTDFSRYNEIVKLGELHSNLKRSNYDLIGWYEHRQDESDHDHSYDEEKTVQDEPRQKHKKYFELNFNNKLIGDLKPKDVNVVLNLFRENLAPLKPNKEFKKKNLVSKHAEFDPKTKTFTMDFKDRAQMPSTNNIQLTDKNDPYKNIVLQMGKIKEKTYTLDFTYPFKV
ncbi:tubby-related 3 isoform X1 [Brachionus plicatilis]|uniref:Tubby-related 3 isoform X1 n=1 Tax=Brachionus plicatilis TaxID=10195 RepID=A0A3M7RV75_BRAPC|nr:tubby-related 3 isoform X1 [Brachionus plicatilis]